MQREMDSLRFNDIDENLMAINAQKYKGVAGITEKHIALSLMNSDRKNFLQSYNDKMRAKQTKEAHDFKKEAKSFHDIQKSNIAPLAFAPDMVKLSKA